MAQLGDISKDSLSIAKDTNKHSKARVALVAVILGGPFIYLGLILIVLYRPEVMTWLGLKSFVAYLIELQPAGYENLVRLNSPAFADYFFNFHNVANREFYETVYSVCASFAFFHTECFC